MAEKYRRREEQPEEIEGQLEGRNALTEALRSGRTIDKVFIAAGETDKALQHLAAQAKQAGAVVVPVDRRKLDMMSTTHSHQGVIALAAAREYFTVEDLLHCLLLHSANDAAVALAEHVAGTTNAYVELMNQRVKKMGCTNTEFGNISGLDTAV